MNDARSTKKKRTRRTTYGDNNLFANEIWQLIFAYVPPEKLLEIRKVSKNFNANATASIMQSVQANPNLANVSDNGMSQTNSHRLFRFICLKIKLKQPIEILPALNRISLPQLPEALSHLRSNPNLQLQNKNLAEMCPEEVICYALSTDRYVRGLAEKIDEIKTSVVYEQLSDVIKQELEFRQYVWKMSPAKEQGKAESFDFLSLKLDLIKQGINNMEKQIFEKEEFVSRKCFFSETEKDNSYAVFMRRLTYLALLINEHPEQGALQCLIAKNVISDIENLFFWTEDKLYLINKIIPHPIFSTQNGFFNKTISWESFSMWGKKTVSMQPLSDMDLLLDFKKMLEQKIEDKERFIESQRGRKPDV